VTDGGWIETVGVLLEGWCCHEPMNLESQVEALQGRVATLEAQMQVLLEHLGVHNDSPGNTDARLLELVRANQLIEAIKLY
jgi:hypothetical protein